MTDAYRYGPFDNDDPDANVPAYPREHAEPPRNHAAFRTEIVDYFTARVKRLTIVKTTETARGQLLDWVPVE